MEIKKKLKQKKQYIADNLKLPRDLSRGEALISITGQEELYIENYKGILTCSSTFIVIATGRYKLQVKGKGLEVAYYTCDEMKITGCIFEILFV